MLMVKTVVKESPIHGKGCFADEDIPNGALIYKFDPKVDAVFTLDEIEKMSEDEKDALYAYGMQEGNEVHLDGDNSHFTNHSDDPNSAPFPDNNFWYAVRFIPKGDEITVDYGHFDNGFSGKRPFKK